MAGSVRLGAGIEGLDLGWHQLRDVPEPVQLFQLGDGRFPPLPIVAESRTNLLAAASRMIGRDEDLKEARAALTESRLVTLTAAGGTGKTRLALTIGEDEVSLARAPGRTLRQQRS